MQTFLPFADFGRTAAVPDSSRLGKHRVESFQILRAIELPEYGWQNHPAVVMWRGRVPALLRYGLDCVLEWAARGSPTPQPRRSPNSLRKSSNELSTSPPRVQPRPPRRLWVLLAESTTVLGLFLERGIVGLTAAAGIDHDVAGLDLGSMRELLGPAGRRKPGRQLLALSQLVSDLAPGDEVATPVESGRALLAGRVAGDYEFAAADGSGLLHRRRVTWERIIPRSSVVPPYALQDVRPLFPAYVQSCDRPSAAGHSSSEAQG
ncbi:MAG: MSMEG_6728 family protein [Nakamurella sp.]